MHPSVRANWQVLCKDGNRNAKVSIDQWVSISLSEFLFHSNWQRMGHVISSAIWGLLLLGALGNAIAIDKFLTAGCVSDFLICLLQLFWRMFGLFFVMFIKCIESRPWSPSSTWGPAGSPRQRCPRLGGPSSSKSCRSHRKTYLGPGSRTGLGKRPCRPSPTPSTRRTCTGSLRRRWSSRICDNCIRLRLKS